MIAMQPKEQLGAEEVPAKKVVPYQIPHKVSYTWIDILSIL